MSDMPPTVVLHVAAGAVALIAGFAALAFRKGGRRHRAAGNIFFLSMLVMAGMGTAMSLAEPQEVNIIAGTLAAYLTTTAWLTARRPEGPLGFLGILAMLGGAGVALIGVTFGLQGAAAPKGLLDGIPHQISYGFGAVAALGVLLDLKILLRGGTSGAGRILRHAWRMGLALLIASAAFFLGQQDEFPKAMQGSPLWFVPVFAVMGAMVFWILRIRFSRAFRGETASN
jgi:hypothetical protein